MLLDCSLCPDDLCEDLNCTNFPTAKCQPEECGVCNATFFINGVDVGDLCGKEIHTSSNIHVYTKLNPVKNVHKGTN